MSYALNVWSRGLWWTILNSIAYHLGKYVIAILKEILMYVL